MTSDPDTASPAAQPVPSFSVVKGDPTEEEIAALVMVLLASTPGAPGAQPRPRSGWSAYWRSLRAPVLAGPSAWRLSGRPQ